MCTHADHDALKLDADRWRALPLVGNQEPYDDERPDYVLEFRNCAHCFSTLAIEVPRCA